MKPVRMNKDVLIEKLRTNRETHRADFEAAAAEYRSQAAKDLRAKARAVGETELNELADVYVHLSAPKQYTKEYDRALAMFESTLDDVIELSQSEFTQYVMDEWSWTEQFVNSTAAYSNKR